MNNLREYVRAVNDFFEDRNTPICIFGAGHNATQVLHIAREAKICVDCFVDNDTKKIGSHVDGVPVVGIDTLRHGNSKVLVVSERFNEIIPQLRAIDFQGPICVADPWFSIIGNSPISTESARRLDWLHSKLEDDESRQILDSILAARMGRAVPSVSAYSQYFHPDVPILSTGIYVDGGAYVGDTLRALRESEHRPARVVSFEPDPGNFDKLKGEAGRCPFPVTAVNSGLWAANGELTFESSQATAGYGCAISTSGDTSIQVVSIDEYFDSVGDMPDFVKLDVEGAEMDVLKGAERTIATRKPKLAISVYHRYQHLWQIPYRINEIRGDYRFYLGHHRKGWTETVLYAV